MFFFSLAISFTKLDEELMLMVVENCRHIVGNALDWKSQMIIQRQNEVSVYNNNYFIISNL